MDVEIEEKRKFEQRTAYSTNVLIEVAFLLVGVKILPSLQAVSVTSLPAMRIIFVGHSGRWHKKIRTVHFDVSKISYHQKRSAEKTCHTD
ncbi:hypothetical protein T4E_8814 [Trichinella pseudospiralis]|uniref:Uncharacterized protein n=1 Tax=Trichinella pseudospiralis TaxID=6337 RepID=A0A0V0YNP9_TRIPS|nr:hypothetical protein T4E_8814 [Trichinella pseudospiralis]KRY83318.1 hypothetical protein T4D_14569 [Trichinella pseudospiralis]